MTAYSPAELADAIYPIARTAGTQGGNPCLKARK